MRQPIILLFLLVLSSSLLAQEKKTEAPNYKKIEKAIKKKKSDYYYPTLFARFQEADSSLTLEEKRHLYYGYTFESEYSPYSRSDYEDSLRSIFEKEELDVLDFQRLINFTDSILAEDPFHLDAMNYQLYASEELGYIESFNRRLFQLRGIIDALMSSGNGASREEAFYVINTSHEYALIDILGFRFGGSQSLRDHYDYLTLAENGAGLEGLWFDVSPCLESLSGMFDKE